MIASSCIQPAIMHHHHCECMMFAWLVPRSVRHSSHLVFVLRFLVICFLHRLADGSYVMLSRSLQLSFLLHRPYMMQRSTLSLASCLACSSQHLWLCSNSWRQVSDKRRLYTRVLGEGKAKIVSFHGSYQGQTQSPHCTSTSSSR